MSETTWLKDIETDSKKLKVESNWRKNPYQEISVNNAELDEYIDNKWEVVTPHEW